ncbi:L-lactate dehydrogenase [Candidatus Woesebacteria bacterium]|nr:L-lactate dehydrogenase [Candidatus Woesebacteria bacterium]MCD8546503.1 L-lactate dehydrogenase [Candidatus Woesebacteria bacterium]
MSHRSIFKVAIVGCGRVGMTAAYSIITSGLATDLVLVGRDKAKLEGEKLDLEHALPFLPDVNIVATDDYADLQGTDVVIFAAGAAQEPGETRLDLAKKNLALVDALVPKILEHAPHTVLLMVTNPVDVLTNRANEISGKYNGRVFGSGTLLDTARFRFYLSEFLDVNPRSIHTYILGEHGDSSFPALSGATLGGAKLTELPAFSHEKAMQSFEQARSAAYRIIEGKGATYYAIGTVLTQIVKSIQRDARTVMPVSHPLKDFYGVSDVSLSVPCIIGRRGIEKVMPVQLDEAEIEQLHASAEAVRAYQQ